MYLFGSFLNEDKAFPIMGLGKNNHFQEIFSAHFCFYFDILKPQCTKSRRKMYILIFDRIFFTQLTPYGVS